MRMSKLSLDTSRLVAALATSPRKTRSSQIREHHRLTSDGVTTSAPATTQEESVNETSEDELPALHTASTSTESSMTTSSIRKRKRGSDIPTLSTSVQASQTKIKQPSTPPSKSTTPAAAAVKARRQPAKRVKAPDGSTTVQPPTGWEETYNLVKAMRQPGGSAYPAVVDTQGCAKLHNAHSSPKDQRFQTLIALMLSSQTKDTVTAAAIARLNNELPTGLNLEGILAVEAEKLDDMIGKVGFHNTKTKYIKQAAIILRDEWGGDIPDTAEGLMSLPGVGPKMAYLCLSVAWSKHEGIGVDVHVHRITNLWNWHGKKTKNPEETRKSLESWLPKDKWHEINGLLVGFGQTVCLPVGRKCENCLLAEKRICPARLVNRGSKKEANVEVKVAGDGEVEIKEELRFDETEITAGDSVDDIEDIGTRKQRMKRI